MDYAFLGIMRSSTFFATAMERLEVHVSKDPLRALQRAEPRAIAKLLSLIDAGDKKTELAAATQLLDRLRGKPIATTHLLSITGELAKSPETLSGELKASQERLQKLLDKRESLKGKTERTEMARLPSSAITVDAELVEV